MHELIAWSGFVGAWLLVAGPLFQAAVELDGTESARNDVVEASRDVAPPPPMSPWWWLLPPVAYVKQRIRSRDYQRAVLDVLTTSELERFVDVSNVSVGWALVAVGAFFIALKETYELCEVLEWPLWVMAPLVVVMVVLCATNVVRRMRRNHAMLSDAERHRSKEGGSDQQPSDATAAS